MLKDARGTKDIDFVLDVRHLREKSPGLADTLAALEYSVIPGSKNFQFEKQIPNSKEVMRIEFMAPEEFKREKDFRVDVDKGVHARFCTGGTVAIAESSLHELSGKLPDGSPFTASVRVTKPHALVMLKLLALDDRYRNVRGAEQAEHDREEARTHAGDVVAIVSGQANPGEFKQNFLGQFKQELELALRLLRILDEYFRDVTSAGLLVYEESIVANQPLDRAARQRVTAEITRAHQTMLQVLPHREFYALLRAIEDCSDPARNRTLCESFLTNLKLTGIKVTDPLAVERIPGEAFGGAFQRGDTFITSSSEAITKLGPTERSLLSSHLSVCAERLRCDHDLAERFVSVLA